MALLQGLRQIPVAESRIRRDAGLQQGGDELLMVGQTGRLPAAQTH